ncbi:MAG: Stk1 family PASTA domain-containing Ser/Thr kinase [Sarcina sp.]
MIGRLLGERYEILEVIGEGGMSYVYKAQDKKLNRFVAVKILKDNFKNNEEIVNKFKREATSIATLSNANIVNVLDVGTQDDKHYIVMEYVKGKTLKDIVVEKGMLPYEVALSIGIKVAKALECAHKSGIIHRDVKPQNILVTEEGVVKVADFGIAKSMDASTIAHTNSVLGSAHYFSPEQAKGSFVDYRTDLYSLGVVLYEMVTGVVPFDGDSPVSVAIKHIQEEPIQPKNLNSSIPDSLNYLIMKAISKEPIERYQTARDIINDLEKIKLNPNVPLGNKVVEEEQFTRVMSPINVDQLKANEKNKVIENDEDDEDDDYDEEYEDEDAKELENKKSHNISKSNKKNKNLLIGIIIAIVVVALGAFAGFKLTESFTSSKNETVEIPNLIGSTSAEAKKQIEGLGLVYNEVSKENDADKDTVIDTNPKAGAKVEKGATVTVMVSSGEEKTKVPNLLGNSLSSAKTILSDLGLKLGDISYEYSDSVKKDDIIKQSPTVGDEATKDTKINLVVSKGKEVKTAKVPELSGLTVEQATAELSKLGFGINAQKGDKAPEEAKSGKIYKQEFPQGYNVTQGTAITVHYYDTYEAPKKTVDVSGLVGKTFNAAQAWGKENKINVVGAKSGEENFIVKSVDKNKVNEGDTVTVTVAAPEQNQGAGNNGGENSGNEGNDQPTNGKPDESHTDKQPDGQAQNQEAPKH